MRRVVADIWTDNRGQDLVEYAFLASLLILGAVTAVEGFADTANGLWAFVRDTIAQHL